MLKNYKLLCKLADYYFLLPIGLFFAKIGVLILIGNLMAYNKGITVPLVFIWALIGIIAENGSFSIIKYSSLVDILLLALITIPQIIKRKRLAF